MGRRFHFLQTFKQQVLFFLAEGQIFEEKMNCFLYARGEALILYERSRFNIMSGTLVSLQSSHGLFTLLAVGNLIQAKGSTSTGYNKKTSMFFNRVIVA